MLNGKIDLHLHSTCSDGLDTPEELVGIALASGYEAISVTDHDTVEGVERALEAAKDTSLEIIPGIELSSMDNDQDIHILGYYIDHNNPDFIENIAFFTQKRYERAEEIVGCLNRLGLDVSFDTVLKIAHGAPIGRPHIAEALLYEKFVYSYNEAFARYIGKNGPAYVPKYKITPRETIEMIIRNGGVPVLAHPVVLNRDDYIFELYEYGLMGLEVIHPLHTSEKQTYYESIAKRYGLIMTGGSDWHGEARQRTHYYQKDKSEVPRYSLTQLRDRSKTGKNNL